MHKVKVLPPLKPPSYATDFEVGFLAFDSFERSALLSLFYSGKMPGGLLGELCGSPLVASEPLTLSDERTEKLFGAYGMLWWLERNEPDSNKMEEESSTGLMKRC